MKSISRAHDILHMLVLKAAMTGEATSSSLYIPYAELHSLEESKNIEFENVDLKISFSLEWSTPWEDEDSITESSIV